MHIHLSCMLSLALHQTCVQLVIDMELHSLLQIADVWSCGVTLYVMLVGGYPFEDPEEPKDFRKMIQVCVLIFVFASCLLKCILID